MWDPIWELLWSEGRVGWLFRRGLLAVLLIGSVILLVRFWL
jgi:hypothetical protein